ncbi:glutaredoxin family protein [Yinghuangia sp. ASG 101]|uniref:glutaredoxin family protein n=1 Tax=Yinghuangia sp. ASG 101 TaxID=2896848 RepID=UPI003FCE7DAA
MAIFRRRDAATESENASGFLPATESAPESGGGSSGSAGAGGRRVTMLSRPGCHLCDDARAVILRVTGELGVAFDEVDITTDPGLEEEYREQIPVTLVNGRQHDFWRVDERRLRAALA